MAPSNPARKSILADEALEAKVRRLLDGFNQL